MLCTRGHNNTDTAKFCETCGINTFDPVTTGTHPAPRVAMQLSSPRVNGYAIAALVLACLGVPVVSLVLGYIARKQIRMRNEAGDGLALAAIIMGWVELVVIVLFIALVGVVGSSLHTQCVGSYC